MGSMRQKRRAIYIGEKVCASLTDAAVVLGVPKSSLHKHLRFGGECEINGTRVSDTPPARVFTDHPARRKTGIPLLRYPLGERPLDRGLSEIWR